jgi:hypothetical protein
MHAHSYAPSDSEIHQVRVAEYDIAKAVITYRALSGHDQLPNPLWRLAERAGWTLEDFIREVLTLGDSVVIATLDVGAHKVLCGDDCPCDVVWAIRDSK